MPGDVRRLKVRSMGGYPIFAWRRWSRSSSIACRAQRRMQWSSTTAEFPRHVATRVGTGGGVRRLLSIVRRPQLLRVLGYMLAATSSLLARHPRAVALPPRHPYVLQIGARASRRLRAGRSATGLFGGNSTGGADLFPVNYLLIESLQKFHHFFGDRPEGRVPHRLQPHCSNLWRSRPSLSRATRVFLRGRDGAPAHLRAASASERPALARTLILFYEYSMATTAAASGANHQTGGTGLSQSSSSRAANDDASRHEPSHAKRASSAVVLDPGVRLYPRLGV